MMDISITRMYIMDEGDLLVFDLQVNQVNSFTKSRYTLRFFLQAWRILQKNRVIIGNLDYINEQEDIIHKIQADTTIIKIQSFNNNLDWRIELPNDIYIEVFSISSSVLATKQKDFNPDGELIDMHKLYQLML